MPKRGIHWDQVLTKIAESACTGNRFAKYGAAEGGIVPCGDEEQGIGVTPYDIASGEIGTLVSAGIVNVDAGGSIDVNTPVTSDANGKAKAAANGEIALGIALQAASDGDVVEINLLTNSLSVAVV